MKFEFSEGTFDSAQGNKSEKEATKLYLITTDQLESLPDGTKLHSLNGQEVIKGVDQINDDERGGYIAYGFTKENIPAGLEVNEAYVEEIKNINLQEILDKGREEGLVVDLD